MARLRQALWEGLDPSEGVANDGTKSCISAVKRITSKTRISRIAKLLFIPALPYAQVFDD